MWNHPGFVATPARVACLAVKPPDCTAKCVNPLVNQMGLEFVQKRRLVLQAYIRQGNRPLTEVSRVGVSCFMYQVIRAPGTWYLACQTLRFWQSLLAATHREHACLRCTDTVVFIACRVRGSLVVLFGGQSLEHGADTRPRCCCLIVPADAVFDGDSPARLSLVLGHSPPPPASPPRLYYIRGIYIIYLVYIL